MKPDRVQGALQTLFTDDRRWKHRGRRVAFWYDPQGEFREEAQTLDLDGVTVVTLADTPFALKRRVLLEEPQTNFLLYAPFPEPPAAAELAAGPAVQRRGVQRRPRGHPVRRSGPPEPLTGDCGAGTRPVLRQQEAAGGAPAPETAGRRGRAGPAHGPAGRRGGGKERGRPPDRAPGAVRAGWTRPRTRCGRKSRSWGLRTPSGRWRRRPRDFRRRRPP